MVDPSALKRIIYASRATGADVRRDREDILASSRRNNGIDGVSGLLWSQADRYLQLLEGPPESVDVTFDRIRHDPRHADIVVIEEGEQRERLFGDWAMAGMPGEHPRDAAHRLNLLLRDAPDDVARVFRANA